MVLQADVAGPVRVLAGDVELVRGAVGATERLEPRKAHRKRPRNTVERKRFILSARFTGRLPGEVPIA